MGVLDAWVPLGWELLGGGIPNSRVPWFPWDPDRGSPDTWPLHLGVPMGFLDAGPPPP